MKSEAFERLGRHIVADFFGVAPALLRDGSRLQGALVNALEKYGFQIISQEAAHAFEGGGEGVTGFVLLSQSHASFHSYPEFGYLALDVYSCGSHDAEAVVREFSSGLEASRVEMVALTRGPRVEGVKFAEAALRCKALASK